ncbi:MAG: formylglycine-generating enzyme family protein [Cyanobacteria bacterium P01_F01_bin.33]
MKRRQLIQFAGLGSVSLLVVARDRTPLSTVTQLVDRNYFSLETFEFDVATVNKAGKIKRSQIHTARSFSEPFNASERLEMVEIAPGNFWMGASKTESSTKSYEAPRHRVNIPPFFMSKFPVTQSQWTAVAALPKINHDLPAEPSHFQGGDLPVESVSWLESVEFCDRLSQHTGRRYQLPSESQWEYACRAGTQTPFHTGDTIASQFANYVSAYTYQAEAAREYRQATVPVGSYRPNAFGLHDMHGNVWEWCADAWHRNYRGSPKNGEVWRHPRPTQMRAIRGGGWLDAPNAIRSASRSGYIETALNRTIGFRVAVA